VSASTPCAACFGTARPAQAAIDVSDYDAELVRYQTRLRAATDAGADDRVLDIGCGAGQTTREAASAAVAGSACGVTSRARWWSVLVC